MPEEEAKGERKAIYCECIMGVISSIIAFIGIFYSVIHGGIQDPGYFSVGFTFWMGYLIFSLFIIFLGIRGFYHQKKYGVKKPKKKIKPPII